MIYNKQEQRIIVAILIAIMDADGRIDPNETKFLDQIIARFGVTDSELDEMCELELTEIISQFRMFDDQKRHEAIKLFNEMAACDGYVHPKEIDIISMFS